MEKQELLSAVKGNTCSVFELTLAIKQREQEEFESIVAQLEFNNGSFDIIGTINYSVGLLCETDAGAYVIDVYSIYKEEYTWMIGGYEDDFCAIDEVACGHLSYLNEILKDCLDK